MRGNLTSDAFIQTPLQAHITHHAYFQQGLMAACHHDCLACTTTEWGEAWGCTGSMFQKHYPWFVPL